MKKTLNVVRYALVSLFSFLFIGSALAVEPVAIWEGADLVDGATYTKEGGVTYTLHANGNTVGADGITISTGKGVSVTPASGNIGNQATTVIIRYTNYDTSSLGTDDAQVMIMNHVNTTADRDFIGMAATGEGKLWGIWQNTKWGSKKTGTGYGSAASETKTFAFTWAQGGTAGSYCWMNGASKTGWSDLHGGRQIDSVWVGGPNESTTLTSATNMKILGIAVFDSRLADNDIASFKWPSLVERYQPFMANFSDRIMTITTPGNAGSGVDLGVNGTFALFDTLNGVDSATTFTGGSATTKLPGYIGTNKSKAWWGFASNQGGYSAPGLVMRFPTYVTGRSITVGGTFAPFTVGGLIVEEGASSGDTCVIFYDPNTGRDRLTELGDKRDNGGVPTFFVLKDNFKIQRGNSGSFGAVDIYGDITFDIAEGKSFDCNTEYQDAPITVKPGAIFRMVGEGTFKVSALTATDSVALDYSKQGARVNTTPFVEGNLTTDSATKFVFPSTLAEGTASIPLCSGTLTAVDGVHEITVGDETFLANLTFDTEANTVKYAKVTGNKATISGETTWTTIKASIEGFNAALPTELTLDNDAVIDFDGEIIPALTLKGAHAATLVYSKVPTFTNGIKVEEGATYGVKIPNTSDFSTTMAFTIPEGITYTICGPATGEAKAWTGAITVKGTLKTEGLLALSGNNVVDGGTLEVVSGEVSYTSAGQGVKNGGKIAIDKEATMSANTIDTLSYGNDTKYLEVRGTLTLNEKRWTIMGDCHFDIYGGAMIFGDGEGDNGALDMHTGLTVKASNDGDTALILAPVKYTASVTFTVEEGVTLELASERGNAGSALTKAGAGKLVISTDQNLNGITVDAGTVEFADAAADTSANTVGGSGAVVISAGTYTGLIGANFTGTTTLKGGTLVQAAGTEGTIVVEGGTLKLKLNAEQMAKGYTAAGVTTSGNITFVLLNGTEVQGEGTSFAPQGISWTGAAGDNVWATDANWSTGKAPTADDVVTIGEAAQITVASTDACESLIVEDDITLTGDISGVAAIDVVAEKKLTIDIDSGVTISANGFTGDGDIVVTGAGTVVIGEDDTTKARTRINGVKPRFTVDEGWTGEVQMLCVEFYAKVGEQIETWVDLNAYGNAGSKIVMRGCFGYVSYLLPILSEVEILNTSDGQWAGMDFNNGTRDGTVVFNKITGSGNITSSGGSSQKIAVVDASEFTGKLTMQTNKGITLGSTTSAAGNNQIAVADGAKMTFNGQILSAAGGVSFKGALTIIGTTSSTISLAEGTTIVDFPTSVKIDGDQTETEYTLVVDGSTVSIARTIEITVTTGLDSEKVYPPYAMYGDSEDRKSATATDGVIKIPYGAENVVVQYACTDGYTFSTGSAWYTIELGTVTEPKNAELPGDITIGEAVASIDMRLFPSLASAVAAAEDGATILMNKSDENEAIINKSVTIMVGNGIAITVDAEAGDGVTINFTEGGTVNGNVAVTGGTVSFQTSGFSVPGTFDGTLTYTSGTVTKSDNYAVTAPEGYKWENGTLVKEQSDWPGDWPEADDDVKTAFAAWTTTYGVTDFTGKEAAFLLNVDPADELPAFKIESIEVEGSVATVVISIEGKDFETETINGKLFVEAGDKLEEMTDQPFSFDIVEGKATGSIEAKFIKAKVGFKAPTAE